MGPRVKRGSRLPETIKAVQSVRPGMMYHQPEEGQSIGGVVAAQYEVSY